MSGTPAKTSWVELKLFVREPVTVVFTLALPLTVLFVLGGVFGDEPTPGFYRDGRDDARGRCGQRPTRRRRLRHP